jgi:hypothetical protein
MLDKTVWVNGQERYVTGGWGEGIMKIVNESTSYKHT